MKKIILLAIVSIILFASCKNTHSHYVNGVTITEERTFTGIFIHVDTTYDGVADIESEVLGTDMYRHYRKGDSVSIDVWTHSSYATPIVSMEKSKQDVLK